MTPSVSLALCPQLGLQSHGLAPWMFRLSVHQETLRHRANPMRVQGIDASEQHLPGCGCIGQLKPLVAQIEVSIRDEIRSPGSRVSRHAR